MHITLSGRCPLVKLRLQTNGTLYIGHSSECTFERRGPCFADSLHLYFTPNRSFNYQAIHWAELALGRKADPLHRLTVQTDQSLIQLEDAEVAANFELACTGSSNVIQLWGLGLMRFTYTASGSSNQLLFSDTPCPLQEVNIDLAGAYNCVQSLWLLGLCQSKISAQRCSMLAMLIEPDSQTRQLQFRRDHSSKISVHLPNEGGTRSIESEYECWLFDSTLLRIDCTPNQPPAERVPCRSSRTPDPNPEAGHLVCGICLTASPSHLLQPCAHLYFCDACCDVNTKTCPVCRANVMTVQRIFTIIGC